jgi:hypothetical protein
MVRAIGKRSQAAMEFLMTYGWGILVVLAAIVSLAYFGVLNPGKFFPEACTLQSTSGLACLDFKVNPDAAHLLIMNGGGRDMIIGNITVGDCSAVFNYNLPDGKSNLFSITGCSYGSDGLKIKKDILISYVVTDSSLAKTAVGSIATSVAVQ